MANRHNHDLSSGKSFPRACGTSTAARCADCFYRAYQFPYLIAAALRAFNDIVRASENQFFERMSTIFTGILINWHNWSPRISAKMNCAWIGWDFFPGSKFVIIVSVTINS